VQIKIFIPPRFTKKALNIENLNQRTNREWYYSSSGKASIYHILKNLNITKILIPIYICDSVLVPLKRLNIKPILYDIESEDLNASLDSIKLQAAKYRVNTLLVASMYGNPADMIKIEQYCKEQDIFLIDDSAQSFGAKLKNRDIGTFGDAGFFSFSPGKPTAGHLGSFFWANHEIEIKRRTHCLVHYFKWLDFDYNRYKIYDKMSNVVAKLINLFSRVLLKFIDIIDDDICKFEKEILGGILYESFTFRQLYHDEFIVAFKDNRYFRVIHSLRGKPNNHKFILLFNRDELAQSFMKYIQKNSIYASNGYNLLSNDLEYFPNAKKIDKCVVELPIEDNHEKMAYLFKKVKEFEY